MSSRRGVKREREEEASNDGIDSSYSPTDSSSSQKRGKFERSFVPSWLERFDWLVYDRDRNLMFCGLCTKYRKNNAFTEGCQNFRRDNLNKHMATNDHKFCVEQNGKPPTALSHEESSPIVIKHLPSERASSPITPGGRHSSSDSSRSSGVFSSASSSLPQSPASLPLPSPPAFAPSKTPTSTLHAPVPLLPFHPTLLPAGYIQDPRFHIFHGEPGGGEGKPKDSLPITPNYLANPPFPYMSGSSNFRQPENHAALPSSQSSSHKHASHIPQTNDLRNGTSYSPVQDENELVLKVRVAETPQTDFIEIEIERNRLTFQYVLSIICRELNVNPSHVSRLRKLPNTIVRKDKDVRRFVDFQELEVVLNNRSSGDSYSPRHVDVVY